MEDVEKPNWLPKRHTRAAPVVEVTSVTIRPNDSNLISDGNPWEIYGKIEVQDGTGDEFEIFYQDEDDPQILDHENSHDGLLSLTLTEPIIYFFPVSLKLHLMDRVRNLELVNDTLDIDDVENNGYEVEKASEHVEGKEGSGDVCFNKFPAAVVAHVYEFVVRKKSDSSKEKSEESNDGCINVYGNITAHYESNYGESYSTTLFSVQKDKAVKVEYGTSVKPPRTLVAVPAYATALVIKSHLMDIALDDVVLVTDHLGYNFEKIGTSSGINFELNIHWVHAYPKKRITSSKDPLIPQCSLVYRPKRRWTRFESTTIMEIFSIYIVSNKDDAPNLYGYIDVWYDGDRLRIFSRKKDEKFICSKKVSCLEVDGPHNSGFAGTNLQVTLNLRDDRGYLFCYGVLSWNYALLEHLISWFDRRICGMISCEHGFIAIHYAIFREAVHAKLAILLSCNESCSSDLITNVSGAIVARYNNHDYSTRYRRERYQSVLFSKPLDSPLELICGCDTPLRLLKSVVAVPIGSSLIIDVDLCVIAKITDSSVQDLKGVAEFHLGSESQWTIRNGDYLITTSVVDWSW